MNTARPRMQAPVSSGQARIAEWRRFVETGGEAAVRSALPAHVSLKRFLRVFETVLIQNSKLLECDIRAVMGEAVKAAQLGLVPDPNLGECYMLVEWSANGPQPKLRVGYRGLLKLARQSGDVSVITAQVVRSSDIFRVRLGTEMTIDHQPTLADASGDVVCYYACCRFKDGAIDFEIMTRDQIHRIRDRSDAWKAFSAGKIKSTPWATDEDEMARKTVLRRLLKRVPMSPDTQHRLEEVEGHARPEPLAPPADAAVLEYEPPRSRLDALALSAPPDEEPPPPVPEAAA